MINLFDAHGKLRALTDEETATVETLPDDVRATLFTCIKSVRERDEGTARIALARKDVHAKMAAHNMACMADAVTPRDAVTGDMDHSLRAGANINPAVANAARVAAARAVSAAQRPGHVVLSPAKEVARLEAAHAKLQKVKPQDIKAIAKLASEIASARTLLEQSERAEKLKAAIDAADAELVSARQELSAAISAQELLDRAAGEATNAWRVVTNQSAYEWDRTLPEHIARSKAQAKLHRDHVAAENAERAARVARGEPAEAPKVHPNYQSEFDRKRGTAKRVVRPLMR